MFEDPVGPIEHFSWETFVVFGKEYSNESGFGKDIRIVGKEVSKWQERKGHTLTHEMITGVYEKDVEVLVIGTGVSGLLECSKELKKTIKENGIKRVLAQKTPQACKTYNTLYKEGKKVAFLAHGTC